MIRATTALPDGAQIGRLLLAFVHVDTTSWAVTRQLLKFKELPEVKEIHTVTGESRYAAQSAHTRYAKPQVFA